ncbi:hypothetical protein VNO77_37313 [Canavalia gladiata]|uniref:Uncharacterized protein n=1 Tax=Canavalia gladiata TaxID=3824 RepID=A0AAN9KA58_CANGL
MKSKTSSSTWKLVPPLMNETKIIPADWIGLEFNVPMEECKKWKKCYVVVLSQLEDFGLSLYAQCGIGNPQSINFDNKLLEKLVDFDSRLMDVAKDDDEAKGWSGRGVSGNAYSATWVFSHKEEEGEELRILLGKLGNRGCGRSWHQSSPDTGTECVAPPRKGGLSFTYLERFALAAPCLSVFAEETSRTSPSYSFGARDPTSSESVLLSATNIQRRWKLVFSHSCDTHNIKHSSMSLGVRKPKGIRNHGFDAHQEPPIQGPYVVIINSDTINPNPRLGSSGQFHWCQVRRPWFDPPRDQILKKGGASMQLVWAGSNTISWTLIEQHPSIPTTVKISR